MSRISGIFCDGEEIEGFSRREAGRWWNKDVEIDLLGFTANREYAVFGECKYTTGPVDADVYWQLIEKAKSVHLPDVSQKHSVFFSQSGFTQSMKNLAGYQDNVHLVSIPQVDNQALRNSEV